MDYGRAMRVTSLSAALALLAPPSTTLMSAGCVCTLVGFENGLQRATGRIVRPDGTSTPGEIVDGQARATP
jgi:hypothetical protein